MKGSKMKKMKKRILAALLCTTMMLNTGMSAMADGGTAVSSESAHVHTEECYEKSKTDNLICTKAEAAEGHVHGDTCYEVTSTPELICTQAETAGHTHDDSCMETTKNLTCGTEEHTHGGDCYETETKDVCSDESEEHTCGDGCVETEEVLTCTAEEHTHDDGCYESETNIVCGQNEVEAHTHGEGCYTTAENKVLKCTLEEAEEHTHNDDCYAWEEKLVCTLPETAPAAEQPEKEEKAEEAEEAAEVNLQNDDETGIKVSVKSTSDVIPEDTKVVVAPMEIDEEHETALAEAVSEFEVLGYTAYDISLKDAEDADITLGENKVEVTIDFEELIPEGINAEEVKDVVLVHITTDEEEKLTAETVGTVEITEEKATVEFEADSFSPYVVTYLSETEEAVEEVVVEEPVVEDVVLTYTSEDEAYTATVTAAPEVLENVTAFEAVPVTDEEKITALTEQLTAKAAEAQKTSLGFENYEFKFLDAEGNEVSVNGEVKVSLSFAEERIPEAATAENVDAVDAALLKTGTNDKGEAVLEEINGLISAEAGAVKEVVYTTEAPEELILAWSGDVYRNLEDYEDAEVVIKLSGTEYALQNVVGFNVTPIKEDNEETKEQYAEVAQQLDEKIAEENEAKEEEKEVVGFLAYDITLVDAEGNELEPQGGVRVSMEYKEAAAPEAVEDVEEAEVTIHHFEEDEKGEVKQIVDMVAEETIEAEVTTTENAEVEKAEFVTKGFSVFTITWTRKDVFTLTKDIKVVVADGENYKELGTDDDVLAEYEIVAVGTPPTLYMETITSEGTNKALNQVEITTAGQKKEYQFVRAIVASEDNNGVITAKQVDNVIAIQARDISISGSSTPVLYYMLGTSGVYTQLNENEEEFLAFVYMDSSAITTTGTYWSEDGKSLSDNTYSFVREEFETAEGYYVIGSTLPGAADVEDNYTYSYLEIKQSGEKALPSHIRYYNGKLQYCRISGLIENEVKEWKDVVDAEIRLIYIGTDTIETADTEGLVDINLFNYSFPEVIKGSGWARETINEGEINDLYFGTGNGYSGDAMYNKWTGGIRINNITNSNLAMQGIVDDDLGSDGYPVLKVGNAQSKSLKALFSPNDSTNDKSDIVLKESYMGLNHLFTKDSKGYYEYTSGGTSESEQGHYAYYDAQNGNNKNFKVYRNEKTFSSNATGGDFMPFIPIDHSGNVSTTDEDAYHFGMNVGFDFIMPENGKVNGEDMIFSFSGDDDVWVFIDGKLVLDIGGIHCESVGTINFATGVVRVLGGPQAPSSNNSAINQPQALNTNGGMINNTTKNLRNIFGKNFDANTSHRLEFFFLERGAGYTNCSIKFNLQPEKQGKVEVEKQITNTDKAKYGDVEFKFDLNVETAVGSGVYDKIPQGTPYTLKRDGVVIETREVEADGQFVLKHGESATFENINPKLRYFARELSVKSDSYDEVTIPSAFATYYDVAGNQIASVPDGSTEYIAESNKVIVEDIPKVVFQNQCAESNKNNLYIEKLFDGDATTIDTFSFKVELEGRSGEMVSYANGPYEVIRKDATTVEEGEFITNDEGVIDGIGVGDTVIIKDIMSGTAFRVTEVDYDTNKYAVPVKAVINDSNYSFGLPINGQGDGVILLDKDAKVTITNSLKVTKQWELIKKSSSGDKTLGGAKFVLKQDNSVKYYGLSSEGTGRVTWYKNESCTGTAVTNIVNGTYKMSEIQAPSGYSLSDEYWTIVMKDGAPESITSSVSGDLKLTSEDSIVADKTIRVYTSEFENEALYTLPSTGGHGIYTTMLSGFALMLGAAYVWFTSRREESSNN